MFRPEDDGNRMWCDASFGKINYGKSNALKLFIFEHIDFIQQFNKHGSFCVTF